MSLFLFLFMILTILYAYYSNKSFSENFVIAIFCCKIVYKTNRFLKINAVNALIITSGIDFYPLHGYARYVLSVTEPAIHADDDVFFNLVIQLLIKKFIFLLIL